MQIEIELITINSITYQFNLELITINWLKNTPR